MKTLALNSPSVVDRLLAEALPGGEGDGSQYMPARARFVHVAQQNSRPRAVPKDGPRAAEVLWLERLHRVRY